jgi:hypothetical protein
MTKRNFEAVFEKKKRHFFGSALCILGYLFYNNVLLSQMSQPLEPALIFPSIDNTYWLLLATGIYHIVISQGGLSVVLDILLLSLPILILMLPNHRSWFCSFFVLITFYYMAQNITAGHHFHSLVGMVFLSFAFCVGEKRFEFVWEAVRYYTLFIFVSAAFWKIVRGNIFDPFHMLNILRSQHAQFLWEQPAAIHAQIIRWLMQFPGFCQGILWSGVCVQLVFAIGFFTKKYDRLLLILMVLFVIVNYGVMRIVSFELLILGLTLLSDRYWGEKE